MRRPASRISLLTLSLALSLWTLAPLCAAPPVASTTRGGGAQVEQLRAQQKQTATDYLLGQCVQLGLGELDSFLPTQAFTTSQGRTVVRLKHYHAGHPVWSSQALVHLQADGSIQTLAKGLQANITLTGTPALSADQASAIALKHLAPLGAMTDAPKVELVVFPSALTSGHLLSLGAGLPPPSPRDFRSANLARPYVWAYEVKTRLANPVDAFKEITYLIEGDSGVVLRAWDALSAQAAPVVAAPAKGTGQGFYRGTVSLDAAQLDDGTFALYDPTRGANASNPNPGIPYVFTWPINWRTQADPKLLAWTPWGYQTGILVGPFVVDPLIPWTQAVWFNPVYGQATPAWGDGQQWNGDWNTFLTGGWNGAAGPNGETTAVDVMKTLQDSYDFYQKALNWTGWDGQDCGIYAATAYEGMDNAFWDPGYLGLFIGGGSYPANPNGLSCLGDFDVVSHEYSHAVSDHVGFIDSAYTEEGGLAEGNSDIFAQMITTWARRDASAPDNIVPAVGANWIMGAGVNHGVPMRWLDKPSKDGVSPDAWYSGIAMLDPHIQMGVVSRFFYFLSQGASATVGDDHHSVYLPGGMAGIGNDQATRIWFDVIATRLAGNGTLTFLDARNASLDVATALYGAASAQVAAVENAWAAVNVGPAHGQPMRTQVLFTDYRDSGTDWIVANFPFMANTQVMPSEEPVFPRASVLNNTNPALTYGISGPSMMLNWWDREGGRINPDGSWTLPVPSLQQTWDPYNVDISGYTGFWHFTARSAADPNQFAEGTLYGINTDLDGDGERDALDSAGLAYSWYCFSLVNSQHSIWQDESPDFVSVSDIDIAFFDDAVKNAWPVK